MPLGDVTGDNGIVDTLDDLIGRTLVKVSERNDGKAAHADIFVQKLFRRAAAVLLKLQIFSKGQRKNGNGDIPPCQIGGDLAGHQFGVGAGHIDVGIGILQQAVDSLFPAVHLLHLVQQKIVAFAVGHFLFDVTVHLLGSHAIVQLFRGITQMNHMVCRNAAAEQVVFQHIQNGRFPAAANPGKDLHQRNIPIGFQYIQIVGSNDHGIASLLLV